MRWLRHIFAPSAQRRFPAACMDAIAAAVTASERSHTGQIMVAVEADLPLEALWRGHSARQRAEQAFAQLRTWDTEANNGVLIYLLLAEHAIEVVADRGLRSRVPEECWAEVCRRMQQFLREGQHEAAVLAGIEAVTELLAEHFRPRTVRSMKMSYPIVRSFSAERVQGVRIAASLFRDTRSA